MLTPLRMVTGQVLGRLPCLYSSFFLCTRTSAGAPTNISIEVRTSFGSPTGTPSSLLSIYDATSEAERWKKSLLPSVASNGTRVFALAITRSRSFSASKAESRRDEAKHTRSVLLRPSRRMRLERSIQPSSHQLQKEVSFSHISQLTHRTGRLASINRGLSFLSSLLVGRKSNTYRKSVERILLLFLASLLVGRKAIQYRKSGERVCLACCPSSLLVGRLTKA